MQKGNRGVQHTQRKRSKYYHIVYNTEDKWKHKQKKPRVIAIWPLTNTYLSWRFSKAEIEVTNNVEKIHMFCLNLYHAFGVMIVKE